VRSTGIARPAGPCLWQNVLHERRRHLEHNFAVRRRDFNVSKWWRSCERGQRRCGHPPRLRSERCARKFTLLSTPSVPRFVARSVSTIKSKHSSSPCCCVTVKQVPLTATLAPTAMPATLPGGNSARSVANPGFFSKLVTLALPCTMPAFAAPQQRLHQAARLPRTSKQCRRCLLGAPSGADSPPRAQTGACAAARLAR
jgi:hypothetical protein